MCKISPALNLNKQQSAFKVLRLSGSNQADVVETFNSTSRYLDDLFKPRYLDDLLNIDNPYFEQMVGLNFSQIRQIP